MVDLRRVPGLSRYPMAHARPAGAAAYPDDATIVTNHDTVSNMAVSPDILSVRSGDWESNSTWNLGRAPADGEVVGIQTTHTVTVRTEVSGTYTVGVAGKLAFDPSVNTGLTIQTILVYGLPTLSGTPGELQIGTAAAPIASDRTCEIVIADVAIEDDTDGKRYSNSVLIWGKFTVHGATKTPFERLTAGVTATDTSVAFGSAVSGWLAGDRVLVPDSRQGASGGEDVRVIDTVAGDNLSLSVTAGFSTAHPAAFDKDSVQTFAPHMANLTRNVVIRSEDPDGVRGITMFFFRADIDVRYARFVSLGRTVNASLPNNTTNQIGRYPIHCHHLFGPVGGMGFDAAVDPPEFEPDDPANIRSCDGASFRLIGNVIEDESSTFLDMKWPITLHNSAHGLVKGNVCFRGTGTMLMFEQGTEVWNVIDGNLLCRLLAGTGDRGDLSYTDGAPGREGNGISMPNMRNWTRNNVVADIGGLTCGYHTYSGTSSSGGGTPSENEALNLPAFQGAVPSDDAVHFSHHPPVEWADNEAYSLGANWIGWYYGAGITAAYSGVPTCTFLRQKVWHCSYGCDTFPHNNTVFDGWIVRGLFPDLTNSNINTYGFDFFDYLNHNVQIINCDIQGVRYGVRIPEKCGGQGDGVSDQGNPTLIQDSTLCCYFNVFAETPSAVTGGQEFLPPRYTEVRNCMLFTPTQDDGSNAKKHLKLDYLTGGGRSNYNWIQVDEFRFYDIDGVEGDDSRFWWEQQAEDFVTPETTANGLGAPEADQTNAENWAEHGVAVAGSVMPTGLSQRSGFDGYEEPL